MGSFSGNRADNVSEGEPENVAYGEEFKFLIPKEFGGGYIEDNYQDYGYLGIKENSEPKYDMYELLAFWNRPDLVKHHDNTIPNMKEIDDLTDKNRIIGINIGCYDSDIDKLKYPLKLVSTEYKGTYEDLDKPSYSDPDQGFHIRIKKN